MKQGTKLRNIRLDRKLTQAELADMIDIHQTTISAWESDESSIKIEFLPKLADALKVEISDLLPDGTTLNVNVINNNQEHGVVGFDIKVEKYGTIDQELLDSKNKMIAFLEKGHEKLEKEIQELKEENRRLNEKLNTIEK